MAWLDAQHQPFKPPPPPITARPAIQAWNLMGGELNWTALDTLADLLGIRDPEAWIMQITIIRDSFQRED